MHILSAESIGYCDISWLPGATHLNQSRQYFMRLCKVSMEDGTDGQSAPCNIYICIMYDIVDVNYVKCMYKL